MKQLKKQQGISLLELMVSLSIGLLLLLGLGSVYVVANKANKDNEVLSANAETARQVFDRLNYDFKRAGFVDLYDSPTQSFVAPTPAELGITTPGLTATNCPIGSPVAVGTMYGDITGNKKNDDMTKIYKRLIDSKATDPMNKAFLAPISMVSCGSMRPVFGCDAKISGIPDVFTRATCGTGGSNSIEITYQAVRNTTSTLPTAGLSSLPNSAQNCSYDTLDAANAVENNGFIINRYFAEGGALKCQGNVNRDGSAPPTVELTNGVQELAFRYVTTVPETDADVELGNSDSGRVVTAYQKAGDVQATTLGWPGVVAVEVCVVIATPVLSGSSSSNLSELQGSERPACRNSEGAFVNKPKEDESLYYQRYVRTFSLPNSLYAPIRK